MNLLYITPAPREKRNGSGILALYLIFLPFLSEPAVFSVFFLVIFPLTVWVFRKFLLESFQVPLVTPGQILGKAVLGALITQLSTLLTNDLIYYFLPNYFRHTDLGPIFYRASWESMVPLVQEQPFITALCLVVLLPVVEELLYRGLLFGTLYRRSSLAAFLVTLVLYTFLRLLPVLNRDIAYLCVCAIQYIPLTIYLSWIYVRSDTIAAPLAAHMLINAANLYILRSYYA